MRKIKLQTLDHAQRDDNGLCNQTFSDGQCYKYTENGLRILPDKRITSNKMTIEKCKTHCFEEYDYLYAGVYRIYDCYCGNVVPSASTKRSSSYCHRQCAGNSSQICGDNGYMNVYHYYKIGENKYINHTITDTILCSIHT